MNQDKTQSLPDSDIWVVRSGENGIYAQQFLDNNRVAIGWDVGPLSDTDSDECIKRRFGERYTDVKPKTHESWANQTIRFFKEVTIGNVVATYSASNRLYYIGRVDSISQQTARTIDGDGESEYKRDVEWLYEVRRDVLTEDTRNSLGSALTLFRLPKQASQELRSHCFSDDSTVTSFSVPFVQPVPSDSGGTLEDYDFKAKQFVEDQIAKLNWQQLQDLVAGILRAMGYRTKISGPGPDRGVDIFASPDGLGLTEPRIFVEVKHRSASVSADQVRSFLGGRRNGDRCLYVSTGGFSKEALYEADRATIPLTIITTPELRELLLTYYEQLDSETCALVPLRKVFLPIYD